MSQFDHHYHQTTSYNAPNTVRTYRPPTHTANTPTYSNGSLKNHANNNNIVVSPSPSDPTQGVATSSTNQISTTTTTTNKSSSSSSAQTYMWQWNLQTVKSWVDSLQALKPDKKSPTFKESSELTLRLINNFIQALQYASSNNDTFNILDPSFIRGQNIVHTPGAILSRLSLAGVINGISGKPGGIFDDPTTTEAPPSDYPAENLKWARTFSRIVLAKIEIDMLESTPSRIVEMLCPDLGLNEVSAIRKRIYATVMLGKGTGSSAQAAALEGEEDVPVAAKIAQHDSEKFKKCKNCGNNDQANFVLDRKNGDLICTNCGTVATESLLHEGSAYRKFEGEADRNHHGDAANPLYSNAHNMGTTLSGVSFTTGAGVGWGSKSKGLETILKHTHNFTEMSLSQFGKEEKKTRIGYKDKQKRESFKKLDHVGDALSLHDAVVHHAKVLFAGFRDDRELVQQIQGVLAACLWESFDQLSKSGKITLKEKISNDGDHLEKKEGNRAHWRNDMHKASLASKTMVDKADSTTSSSKDKKAISPHELKNAKLWDIDDCRSWLIDASKTIAKKWVDASEAKSENNKANNGGTLFAAKNNNIPKGSLDELEGTMINHSLTICDHLEKEISKANNKPNKGNGPRKTLTPRVKDMSKLGIRWQGQNERGSGGRGGVGNSGRTTLGTKPGEISGGRTAGQILLLLTAKQFGSLVKDTVAGNAFHIELRSLLSRQNSRKRKSDGEAAASKRCKQLKRKPWLAARAAS